MPRCYESIEDGEWMVHNKNHPDDKQITMTRLEVTTLQVASQVSLKMVQWCPGTNFGNSEDHAALSVMLNEKQIDDLITELTKMRMVNARRITRKDGIMYDK